MRITKRKLKSLIENFIFEQATGEDSPINSEQLSKIESKIAALESRLKNSSWKGIADDHLIEVIRSVVHITSPENLNAESDSKDYESGRVKKQINDLYYSLNDQWHNIEGMGVDIVSAAEEFNTCIDEFTESVGLDTGLSDSFGRSIFNVLNDIKFNIDREGSMGTSATGKEPATKGLDVFERVAEDLVDGAFYVRFGEPTEPGQDSGPGYRSL